MPKMNDFLAGFVLATLVQIWVLTFTHEDAKIALRLAYLDGVTEGSKQSSLKCIGVVRP